jgi:phage-related protein
LAGDILVRAEGLNTGRVRELGVVDNTDIYRLMYLTLFDRWLP